jgi:hypothetical protein
LNKSDANGRGRQLPGKTREEIADLITNLYFQPIVALP